MLHCLPSTCVTSNKILSLCAPRWSKRKKGKLCIYAVQCFGAENVNDLLVKHYKGSCNLENVRNANSNKLQSRARKHNKL